MSEQSAPTILEQLASFVAALSYDDVPGAARDQAKRTFGHNLLVALAARNEELPGQDRVAWPDALTRSASATRLTDGRPAPAERAVVTNSLAMGARAQHDEHPASISHLGSTILPPLLAAAEQIAADGSTVLVAMVAGYEVGARIGAASVRRTSERGFRPTGLYGPFAGAAAVAKVRGLDAAGITTALAFAANASAGLTQTWLAGTDEWRYQTAFAARNGYVAAELAAEGLRGAPDSLEGANGFARAFAGEEANPSTVLGGLGQEWALEHILLKPYPVCAFNQAPVQQTLALVAAHELDADDVERIVVRMNPEDLRYPGVDTTAPVATRSAALMCLRTCLSLAVLHGDVPIDALDRPDIDDVRTLFGRIDLLPDPGVPSHTSSVTITTADAVVVDSGPARETVYDDEVARGLVERLQPATGLDDAQVVRFRAILDHMEEEPVIEELLALVRASAR